MREIKLCAFFIGSIFTGVMFICGNAIAAIQFEAVKQDVYKVTNDVAKKLGLSDCQDGLKLDHDKALVVCHRKKSDNKSDYGLRLNLINTAAKSEKIIYSSKGAGDSYYIRLKAFQSGKQKPALVMAENGAEYSYGVDVYTLSDSTVTYLGNIDAVVDDGGNAGSVVPHINIVSNGDVINFGFTQDVLRPDGKGGYYTISKGKISYSYTGKQLTAKILP